MSSRSSSPSLLMIFLTVALLGISAFLWYSNSQLKSELDKTNSQYVDLEKVNTELNFNYQAKLEELEDLRGDNEELNTRIDEQKAELNKQKKRISGLIWTEKELGKARQEMESMTSRANQYIAELSRLKKEKEALQAQNTVLNDQNVALNETVQVNEKRINSLDSVKTILVSQTEDLSEENSMLSSKVDMAEAIKINFIEVKGYDVKDDGSVKAKSRAKKVDMLRACFTTETNLVVPSGQEEFQVRYTSPTGEVLYVEELGSSSTTNKLTQEKVRYTTSGEITYNNEDTKACIDWTPNFQLGKGIYKVEMFNDGFPVGQGEFKLK